ncbi:MAG: hypothetical protein CSA33_08195 [Desulfobulbus propionicus]|nr:MAG: hypothetical protein CSA33_08195 [Desulfobulbus propionicus]
MAIKKTAGSAHQEHSSCLCLFLLIEEPLGIKKENSMFSCLSQKKKRKKEEKKGDAPGASPFSFLKDT